jgi:hypothetical protein
MENGYRACCLKAHIALAGIEHLSQEKKKKELLLCH